MAARRLLTQDAGLYYYCLGMGYARRTLDLCRRTACRRPLSRVSLGAMVATGAFGGGRTPAGDHYVTAGIC